MNDRLRFEVNDNRGRFVFPDTGLAHYWESLKNCLIHTILMKSVRRVTSTNSDVLLNGSLTLLIYTHIWHTHFWNRAPRVKRSTPLLKGCQLVIVSSLKVSVAESSGHTRTTGLICACFMQQSRKCTFTTSSGCHHAH